MSSMDSTSLTKVLKENKIQIKHDLITGFFIYVRGFEPHKNSFQQNSSL